MLWTIGTVTLNSRKEMFEKLRDYIDAQIKSYSAESAVEFLFLADDGKMPVGYKRNAVLKNANGKFVSFVDDDDWVSETYVKDILMAITNNPKIDCVGLKGVLVRDGKEDGVFIHSVKYDHMYEDKDFYYRPPNHLNPVRTEIALQYKFPIQNLYEDSDYCMRMANAKALKKEAFIDKILYRYNFSSDRWLFVERGGNNA